MCQSSNYECLGMTKVCFRVRFVILWLFHTPVCICRSLHNLYALSTFWQMIWLECHTLNLRTSILLLLYCIYYAPYIRAKNLLGGADKHSVQNSVNIEISNYAQQLRTLLKLAGVPVGRKSSVCLICMKYRIIILSIIIKRLGEILLSYIANTSRTHSPSVGVVSITAFHSW